MRTDGVDLEVCEGWTARNGQIVQVTENNVNEKLSY